jgi:hypothetical protein
VDKHAAPKDQVFGMRRAKASRNMIKEHQRLAVPSARPEMIRSRNSV